MILSPTAVVVAVALLFVVFFVTGLIKPTERALIMFFVCAVIVGAMLTLSGCATPSKPTVITQTGDVQTPYLPWGYNIRNVNSDGTTSRDTKRMLETFNTGTGQ